ncbi:Organic cation/carnitine transporter 4 [Striga hermonthica]|uniref:Organic cation/carnitine transporter 4 n=1 Tax=Striga hermonthica TaxID=68872 RepID=A0A9N7RG16_STRHE|nr:Organic cation/carnitine transporter 4 [Striga hermonthica]
MVVGSQSDLRSPLFEPEDEARWKPEPVERLCIDEMLTKHCGELGPWQIRHFFNPLPLLNIDGAGVFGHLSDSKLGRKGSLSVVCLLNAVFGCLTALSPNYAVYAVLRLLTGFSTGGVGLCAFVLATEPVGPTKRGLAGMSTFYFFSGGIAALAGIAAFFTASWRALYVATSLPSLAFLLAVLPFVSESPRWCLIRGKIVQATNIMRNIARDNGRPMPDGVALALDEDKNGNSGSEKTGSLIDVIRSPMTRARLFLAVSINFFCSVVYYGLSLNVVNLGTNLNLNVFLNSVAELPAYLLTAGNVVSRDSRWVNLTPHPFLPF